MTTKSGEETAARKVRVGARWIGEGEPCYIIAEAGSNHNGSLKRAKELIDAAVAARADCVKFQVFRAERLYPKNAGLSGYLKSSQSIYDIIRQMELPYEWLPELAAYCRSRGIQFMASAFDEESVDQLDPHVEAFKIASYEMTHVPLVRHVAAKGKPMILSTGTAEMAEVAEMVAEVRQAGCDRIMLMQCTAAYPAPLESLNVRAVATLKSSFGVPAGLSDHSRDPLVGPLAAVAIGANLLEKHVTLSNELSGPDHQFALEPHELRLMVEQVRAVERALGGGEKIRQPVEAELFAFARRSIFAVAAIRRGERITPHNVAVLRMGTHPAGLPPKMLGSILGREASRDISPEQPIHMADLA